MENITLALAVLLGFGFAVAKLGQLFKLPSVTGYICAGIILGPSGFNLLSAESIGHQLGHFTQIALMMIAFGIGEHLELKRLRASAKSVISIGVFEIIGAFFCVSIGSFFVARLTGVGLPNWSSIDYALLATLLGAVSVATAPAATMHVVRELRASGPLTTTLMAVIAIDNGLAIMLFGVFVALAHQFVAVGGGSVLTALSGSMVEIAGSLLMGVVTGVLIDFVNNRLCTKNEMLTAGLSLLLLCGEGARMFNMSPLLAGMAAGFTIVNRDHRDMRLFRALNAFEPPIYVLFFTLAGVHLHLSALSIAGWLGVSYFVLRSAGKVAGAWVGAKLSSAPETVKKYLGLALTPQAGVAIGLIFLINEDAALNTFAQYITPVVLAGVMLSELVGPVFAKSAVKLAGEAFEEQKDSSRYRALVNDSVKNDQQPKVPDGVPMVPWVWERFPRKLHSEGVVVFGAAHIATGSALARMAAIFAHHYDAYPLAARIILPGSRLNPVQKQKDNTLLAAARIEVESMGSELYTAVRESESAAKGILEIAGQNPTKAIVLGHSMRLASNEFHQVIGAIVEQAPCLTIIIKFKGILHTERILVPFVTMQELLLLREPVKALAAVGRHHISFLQLMPSYATKEEVEKATGRLGRWLEMENLSAVSSCDAVATESRKESVLERTADQDVVIMAGPKPKKIRRLLFGSLAAEVSKSCPITLITVYPPAIGKED